MDNPEPQASITNKGTNKKFLMLVAALVIVIVVLAGVLIFFVTKEPSGGLPKRLLEGPLEIKSFEFSEVEEANNVTVSYPLEEKPDTIAFEGMLEKAGPCNTLSADYNATDDDMNIEISQTAGDCPQENSTAFFKGQFVYTGKLGSVGITFEGKRLGKAAFGVAQ